MPRTPIQEEPESTVGKKPERFHADERAPEDREHPREASSGAASRRDERDETEARGEARDREEDEPPSITGLA